MKKVFLTALCGITVLSLMFVSGCRKSADDIEVQTSGDAVVWKYASESEWHELVKISELNDNAEFRKTDTHIQWCTGKGEWHDLIAIAELTGAAGKDGADGINGTDGTDGKNGVNGTNGKDGINGIDGKEVELKKTETHLQWRLAGGEWQNLVALTDIAGPTGADGKTPEFRTDADNLQWRYKGETLWLNLYDLSALKGADGKDGKDGINGTNGIDGKDGKDGIDGINGTNGKDGVNGADGKEIELKKTNTHIQWRLAGGEWQNLVALTDIAGPTGADGKTPEFRTDGDNLQWRYKGETLWLNLYDLSALKGADGKDGINGTNGIDGKDGKDGINGTNGVDGKDGKDGINGTNGINGKDGVDGKDGVCSGYFYASGNTLPSWGSPLTFSVKTASGGLITYDESKKTVTLKKGHTYSLSFNGSAAITVSGGVGTNGTTCGIALVDGYDNETCMNSTLVRMDMTDGKSFFQTPVVFNRIYSAADGDITLTLCVTNYMLTKTKLDIFAYNMTVIALD